MSTKGNISQLFINMLISCAFSPNNRGTFFPEYHTFKYSSFIKKLLLQFTVSTEKTRPFSIWVIQLFCLNLQHFEKKTSNIGSNKHQVNFLMLPVMVSKISWISTCRGRSACFGKYYRIFLWRNGLQENKTKGAFYHGAYCLVVCLFTENKRRYFEDFCNQTSLYWHKLSDLSNIFKQGF